MQLQTTMFGAVFLFQNQSLRNYFPVFKFTIKDVFYFKTLITSNGNEKKTIYFFE